MIKNFADKTFIIFFIAILLVSSVFVLNFDKGIEFTDESYPIKLPKLNNLIYVDEFTKEYINQINIIKKKLILEIRQNF
jgi:hypothetical protein